MRNLNQNELDDVNGGWLVPAGRAIYQAGKWLLTTRRGAVVATVATTDIPSTPQGGDE